MFDNNVKQKIYLMKIDEKYTVHLGVQSSLLKSLFGRGCTSDFSADTILELQEKIDSVIEELENQETDSLYGILLVYPHSSLHYKGTRPVPIFKHQRKEVLKDLKNLKTLL